MTFSAGTAFQQVRLGGPGGLEELIDRVKRHHPWIFVPRGASDGQSNDSRVAARIASSTWSWVSTSSGWRRGSTRETTSPSAVNTSQNFRKNAVLPDPVSPTTRSGPERAILDQILHRLAGAAARRSSRTSLP
jgi:hypothetical protein